MKSGRNARKAEGERMQKNLDFDLEQTLECGQCFRWERQPDGSYTGVASGHILNISEENIPQIAQDEFWGNYFDLKRDYAKIRADLSAADRTLAQAAQFAPGMRILNQEPWEALCSFILSQNNNIPRIRGIVKRLCEQFGEPLGDGFYTFPSPERLAALEPEDLCEIRCGFRAKYVVDAARKVAFGLVDLERLKTAELSAAREQLMQIHGVGPKVADCTLLYGLHRLEAFPMDVWMKRAMQTLFPGRSPEAFGRYAGIAQQYIFHYSRCNPELFAKERQHAG
ncbi:MAG: DNA-3-methyladenine glycosylase 2 family protein [Clostridiales bacterium]|nr:DNA-3-methyladenine glycosylase 2 family protein [Clostridiales bacterium]